MFKVFSGFVITFLVVAAMVFVSPSASAAHGTALTTTVAGAPGAVTYSVGSTQMAVAFVRGANGHLEANWFDGEQWHWIDQGTPPNTTVASVPSATTYQ